MIVFISHGAPTVAIEDDDFTRAVETFGSTIDPPALVIVSAHWQSRGLRVNAVAHPEPIYDFGGFAPELFSMRYDAPGAPELAERVAAMTGATLETQRGWDHGVWVPLRRLFPEANTPVVQLSLPHGATSGELLDIGRRLAPLRDEGILLTGSGGIVHNLGRVAMHDKTAPVQEWAREFDSWFASRLDARDFSSIARWRELAPHASLAVPTPEHFEPVLVVLGAARGDDELVTIHEGFHHGTLSMRSFALQ